MTKRTKQALAILIIIFAAFSLAAFIIPFNKGGVFWVAYVAEVIAIAAQIPIFKLAYDGMESMKSKVLGFPVFRVGYIYLGVQTAASAVLFILGGMFKEFPLWIAFLLCGIILAVALICSVAADIAMEELVNIETAQAADTAWMKQMRVRAKNLAIRTTEKDCNECAEALYEQFRYSDPVSCDALRQIEINIDNLFSKLEVCSDKESFISLCSELKNKLSNRNNMCKGFKK